MKRFARCAAPGLLAAALLMAGGCGVLHAQAPAEGLRVEGETTIVVTKVPFKVVAPAGGKWYYWILPPGWEGETSFLKNSVEVTKATEGAATVKVAVFPKGDAPPAELKLSVTVGRQAPPPPDPSDPLADAVRGAFSTEPAPGREAQAKTLAAYYRAAANIIRTSNSATVGPLWEALAAKQAEMGAAVLPAVRGVVRAEVRKVWPSDDPAAPLTNAARDAAAALMEKAAAALEGLS